MSHLSQSRTRQCLVLAGALLLSCVSNLAFAQAPPVGELPPQTDKTLLAPDGSVALSLTKKFQTLLTGAKMVGMFTVDGRPLDKLSPEQYEIQKVEKQTEGDWWLITARVKYGEKDFSIPVPVEVKWAGQTPVITLDKVTLPGYGTFSARVVFHGDRYAGTWQHDDKGGHLFGKVELAKP